MDRVVRQKELGAPRMLAPEVAVVEVAILVRAARGMHIDRSEEKQHCPCNGAGRQPVLRHTWSSHRVTLSVSHVSVFREVIRPAAMNASSKADGSGTKVIVSDMGLAPAVFSMA